MKIAVAIDGSKNALRAAKHAISTASHFPNATLEIIYVADHSKAKEELLLSQSQDSLTVKREQKLQPVVQLTKEAKIETNVVILKGNPSIEIVKHVNQTSVDQLFIGSRGLNTFQEMILGSVSHKVMKHVTCPVTVVK